MAPTIQSPLPTLAPTATPKGMSSRLMTMKFMQRGEASAKSSPSTTPKTDSEGSAKRRKTAHKETPEGKPLYDEKAVQAALQEEESKRQAAIARRAKELGDEQWVLTGAAMSVPNARHPVNLNYVQVGFAQIDAGLPSDDDDDSPAASDVTGLAGRRQFNMKKAKKAAVVSGIYQCLASSKYLFTDEIRKPRTKVIAIARIQITSQAATAHPLKKSRTVVGSLKALRPATESGLPIPCLRDARPND